MTLEDFHRLTAGMPASTPILSLNPWGEFEPAALVTVEDLIPGDPMIPDFPPNAIVITGDADLAINAIPSPEPA